VTLTAEAVDFLQGDPRFDGKGLLVVTVHGKPMPDGGPGLVPSTVVQDGGAVDLSAPLPEVRIDGLPPTTVYPQAVFIDDPDAGLTPRPGWWLGGYDFSRGLQDAPLKAITLHAGESASVSMDLRALRALLLRVSAAVPPAGNGQGPMNVLILEGQTVGNDAGNRAWGFGTAACANCVADGGPNALAFFVGSGPYYTLPVLDDFNLGGNFPPGAMTSLDVDAGLVVPVANRFNAGSAYVLSQSVRLNYVNAAPDGGVDEASCPP
jgi:hypothetical protein